MERGMRVILYFCSEIKNQAYSRTQTSTEKMTIKKFVLIFCAAITCLCACNDDDTYADRVKRERKQIQAFLKTGAQVMSSDSAGYLLNIPGNIEVISESDFYANDSTTDVSKNQYVLFAGSGVYMQIVRKGTGSKIKNGETLTILNRYTEFNISTDTLQTTNRVQTYAAAPDAMSCTNTNGLFSASYTSGVMLTTYKTSSVPTAWLIPLSFINLGRQDTPDGGTALVRLIVPSTQGQSDASYNVYPCAYEITYQRGR